MLLPQHMVHTQSISSNITKGKRVDKIDIKICFNTLEPEPGEVQSMDEEVPSDHEPFS